MPEIAPNGTRMFFATNSDLVGILGDTDFDFENFYFLICLDPRFPEFKIPGFP